jgi:hypothetical protein
MINLFKQSVFEVLFKGTFAAFIIVLGASCDDGGGGSSSSSSSSSSEPTAGSVITPQTTTSTFQVNPVESVISIQLTPEQIESHLKKALLWESPWTEPGGWEVTLDFDDKFILLGGLDFVNTSYRDRETKINHLMTVRLTMFEIATRVMWREAEDGPFLFTNSTYNTDRPYISSLDDAQSEAYKSAVREAETRWQKDLEAIFVRLLARNPTSNELAALKTAFSDIHLIEGNHNAWAMIIYSLISTTEFWNL